ncbi:MAG: HEAT repeat domain-containing protein [Spirochaetaceae bacterium]|jgi:HEAT repeat protein|nr:HEAT repeat domain-containing protein [Spirochaetaceae bacterium]
MNVQKRFVCLCLIGFALSAYAEEGEEGQRDALRYGTDAEIVALMQSLKKNKADYLDAELAELARATKNPRIKSAALTFFAEKEKSGLEGVARALIETRDELDGAAVIAAMEYLAAVRAADGQDVLRAVLESGEDAYRLGAIRAIGRATGSGGGADAAEYLIAYYGSTSLGDDAQRELVAALGQTRSKKASGFLVGLMNENARVGLTLAALGALEAIGDEATADAVVSHVFSKDPNVRAAAAGALGSFSGDAVNAALIDAFRDSHYKTRLAAIKSAARTKPADAAPYLKFRAENDEVPAVKEEAVRALAALAAVDGKAADALEAIFNEKKTPDKVRALAAEELVGIDGERYSGAILEKIEAAKRGNQKVLYNALIGAVSKAKSDKLLAFAGALFASGNAGEIAIALEITGNNRFTAYLDQTTRLAADKNSGLARMANEVLQKLQ